MITKLLIICLNQKTTLKISELTWTLHQSLTCLGVQQVGSKYVFCFNDKSIKTRK